jgi:hypothetical protein
LNKQNDLINKISPIDEKKFCSKTETNNNKALEEFQDGFGKLKKEIQSAKTKPSVDKILTALIRLFGAYLFHDDSDLKSKIKTVTIKISKEVDYDNFENFYNVANLALKEHEENYDIIINCSSGTSAATSALSILSMQSNRKLLYCTQGKSKEIKVIAHNKLAFKELIDQVAEELSND